MDHVGGGGIIIYSSMIYIHTIRESVRPNWQSGLQTPSSFIYKALTSFVSCGYSIKARIVEQEEENSSECFIFFVG